MAELKFYTYPSCTSCRKTKKWLVENQILFEERHLFRQTPTVEELTFLLSLTTEGLDEILATRSQSFKELNLEIDDLPLSKVVELIVENPKLLRRPILTDGKQLVVGYQPEHLGTFCRKRKLFPAV
ncbi:Spx/MgsR family RNA polymerase-binding regulatory protein [Paenisporosarcina macmurdoensis]|jgi:Spx/MgsR family transcriptional regulator|uniref:Spx/MgsR family RNA polymerase-binding regulatory protein n=1 Tax=Paenisporosarcina macmurdoensis TaxID=212659 RepID=A0ABW1L9H8_9BACL